MKLTGEIRSTRRKTDPSAALSTTNPTWTDPGLHDKRPATNRLSHGMSFSILITIVTSYLCVVGIFTLAAVKGPCQGLVSRRPLTAEARVRSRVKSLWGLWWTKWHWDRFFFELSVFPCQFHSTGAPLFVKLGKKYCSSSSSLGLHEKL
jgi:hypothetical protein